MSRDRVSVNEKEAEFRSNDKSGSLRELPSGHGLQSNGPFPGALL